MGSAMLEELKLPPHSIEAEQSVIGGLLLDNNAIDKIVGVLNPADFYRHDHRIIFEHIGKIIGKNDPADIVTVSESLESAGQLERVGGIAYIGAMAQNTPTAANIRRYAEIVHEKALARNLISITQEIQDGLFNGGDIQDQLERAQFQIMSLTEKNQTDDPVAVRDLLPVCVDRIDAAAMGNIQSIATGYQDIDDKLGGGFEAGNLVILAGRPSMGKTSLAINIAENIQTENKAAFVFTCEMGNSQIVTRMISSAASVSSKKFRSGKMDDEDWVRLTSAIGRLNNVNMLVDDRTFTLGGLRAKARSVKRKHGLSVIVVDYIQLLRGEGDNREQQVSSISRGLKEIAKELSVPVIALSQLSRECEKRADKRPMMSDLRDSGAIEQDADIIMFIYRDEFYNPDSPEKGVAEINFAKQRDGEVGRVMLTFDKQFTKFKSFAGQVMEFRKPAPKTRGFRDE
jgi:replicative DNA helicase